MIKNQRGNTLVETIISAAIFLAIVLASAEYFRFLNNTHQQLKFQRVQRMESVSSAQAISYDVGRYQVNYRFSELNPTFANEATDYKEYMNPALYPYALSGNGLVNAADCAQCKYKMGIIISPSKLIRNLFEVKYLFAETGTGAKAWDQNYYVTSK